MPKYAVTLYETNALTITVEANSRTDAETKAREALYQGEDFDEVSLGTDDTSNVEELKDEAA